MLLFRVLRPLQQRLRVKLHPGLGPSHFVALRVIRGAPEGGARISDIARKLQLSPAAVTQVVTELERRDLVLRQHGTSDRRAVLVQLSAKGQKTLEEQRQDAVETVKGILGVLEPEDRQALVRILHRLGGDALG